MTLGVTLRAFVSDKEICSNVGTLAVATNLVSRTGAKIFIGGEASTTEEQGPVSQ